MTSMASMTTDLRSLASAIDEGANHSGPTITWQVEQAICPSHVPSSGTPAAWPTRSSTSPG